MCNVTCWVVASKLQKLKNNETKKLINFWLHNYSNSYNSYSDNKNSDNSNSKNYTSVNNKWKQQYRAIKLYMGFKRRKQRL